MTQPVIYAQEELEVRCKVWQERLRLQDWIVKVSLEPHFKLLQGTGANVAITLERKEAIVYILQRDDYPPDDQFPQDMENSLVHELLHLHFEPLGINRDGSEHVAQEQAICCIASSLVKAWRRVEQLEAV